ncbi:MAG: glycosyltransferase family 4 protein, partial [Solirubrobacterales bacterium]
MRTGERSSKGDTSSLGEQRVLVLHNRYRRPGGEERYVQQLGELLERETGFSAVLERSSKESGAVRAGTALVRGGLNPDEVGDFVRDASITVVHAHNVLPSFGWRALAAASEAGAAVVLHLHNYRLFCAIGTAFRDGHDCNECAPNSTRAGLKHNCRGSLPQAAAYAYGLGRWQSSTIESVDRFAAPVRQLGDDLSAFGIDLPFSVLPSWLPDSEFANASQAGSGEYALFVGRVTEDKGIFVAIEAAAASGVPLRVAGEGPDIRRAQQLAADRAAPVEFLGRIDGQAMVAARMGAAFAVLPSVWREVLPLSGLEALAAGLPLVTSDRGGLPELTEPGLVCAAGDHVAMAAAMTQLFADRDQRQAAGAAALDRAR